MEEVRDALSSNVREFSNMDSPIAERIDQEIQEVQFDSEFNGIKMFVEEMNSVKSNGEELQELTVNDVLGSMEDDIDHVAGQLGVCQRVIRAGAGSKKAAEYLQNASDSCDSALEKIDSLVDYVNGEGQFAGESLVEDSEAVDSIAVAARMDIGNLQLALDAAVERFTD